MSTTVIVEQISPTVERSTIEDLFAECGTIKHVEWLQPPTPTAFQSAIIEYEDAEQAQAATFLNHALVVTHLVVTLKQPPPPATEPQTASPSHAGAMAASPTSATTGAPANGHTVDLLKPTIVSSRDDNGRTIYVGNLSPNVSETMLKVYFNQIGTVVAVKLQADPTGQSPNRFAFVEFLQLTSAKTALTYHLQSLDGRQMKVGTANNPIIKNTQIVGANDYAQDERVRAAIEKVRQHINALHRKYEHIIRRTTHKRSLSQDHGKQAEDDATALLSTISQPPTHPQLKGHDIVDRLDETLRPTKRQRQSDDKDTSEPAVPPFENDNNSLAQSNDVKTDALMTNELSSTSTLHVEPT